jgi:type IV secretion system protein VirD4
MQLPPSDELVLVSGTPPIRAKKARYFKDRRLATRVLPPPTPASLHDAAATSNLASPTDWTTLSPRDATSEGSFAKQADTANSGIRREPALPQHETITREAPVPLPEFALLDDERSQEPVRTAALQRSFTAAARQAAMDPDDGMAL